MGFHRFDLYPHPFFSHSLHISPFSNLFLHIRDMAFMGFHRFHLYPPPSFTHSLHISPFSFLGGNVSVPGAPGTLTLFSPSSPHLFPLFFG